MSESSKGNEGVGMDFVFFLFFFFGHCSVGSG